MRNVATKEHGRRWLQKLEPLAGVLLAAGLVVAVATDGELPGVVAKGLFGVLVVLDAVVIHWLTRSRTA